MQSSSLELNQLLQRWSEGDTAAFDELVPIVYEGLRQVAHERRHRERNNLSLNTTAIVHEAYFKLAALRQARFHDREHFLAMASRIMRRLLVDHARARSAGKRGSDVPHVELVDEIGMTDENASLVADLDESLQQLEMTDARASRVLEQHYFGGLTLEETAGALGVSLATVKRDLRFARTWLAAHFADGGAPQ